LRFAFENGPRVGDQCLSCRSHACPPVNLLAGGRIIGDAERQRPDGSRVRVTCVRLTRLDWLAACAAPAAAAHATAAAA
jgi:hypothetical protein